MSKYIYTHGGTFHADEVCAVAFLRLMLNEEIPVVRGFDPPTGDPEAIVLDIGDGEFDHHSEPRASRDLYGKEPYAAFGKIVKAYGPKFLSRDVLKRFDFEFVKDLDIQDNLGGEGLGHLHEFAQFIQRLNPTWNEEGTVNVNDRFEEAVTYAKRAIERKLVEINARLNAINVARTYPNTPIVFLREKLPASTFTRKPAKLLITESERGGYNLVCVRRLQSDGGGFKVLIPDNIDYKGITFLHPSRHIATFETQQDAFDAAHKVLGLEPPK